MTDVGDVVVVGGGIGGASLAFALACEGLGVVVLEASTEYEDRVRGESMQAWGVKEARDLGVEDAVLAAGAHISPLWKQYSESTGAADIPAGMMVEDIPGTLNLRHPVACQTLIDAAAGAAARRALVAEKMAAMDPELFGLPRRVRGPGAGAGRAPRPLPPGPDPGRLTRRATGPTERPQSRAGTRLLSGAALDPPRGSSYPAEHGVAPAAYFVHGCCRKAFARATIPPAVSVRWCSC